MRFTDQHHKTFVEQGFVIVEKFFTEEERLSALEGYHKFFAPTYRDYVAAGRKNETPKQAFFPWNHAGLNYIGTHPEIIGAAERIIGTREIRVADCELNLIYAGDPRPMQDYQFHSDYKGNSLGPYLKNDRANISFLIALEDVDKDMAPTLMVPSGKPDEEYVPMIVPGGSVCIYSTISTRHSASKMIATEGYRANMWTIYSRKDQLWNGATWFNFLSSILATGLGAGICLNRFISDATPRQLELLGFPPVESPAWTDAFLDGMTARYPELDTAPYRAARNTVAKQFA